MCFKGQRFAGLLDLILPYAQCKIFVQKYKRHGLMFNVCVLFCFVGTRKSSCYVTVHTVNKTALICFLMIFVPMNLDF